MNKENGLSGSIKSIIYRRLLEDLVGSNAKQNRFLIVKMDMWCMGITRCEEIIFAVSWLLTKIHYMFMMIDVRCDKSWNESNKNHIQLLTEQIKQQSKGRVDDTWELSW